MKTLKFNIGLSTTENAAETIQPQNIRINHSYILQPEGYGKVQVV